MIDDPFPVQWTGQQAVVTFPEHIGISNADQIREQLLWIINRSALVLIADLTGTISCDYSAANALARAYQRAIANGTELRLVVTAEAVHRVLRLNGVDRLVSIYPDMQGAVAAGAERRDPRNAGATPATHDAADGDELLELTVVGIFNVGLILQAATDLPPDVISEHIIEALRRLDDTVKEIRYHVFAKIGQGIERVQGAGCDPAGPPPPSVLERSARARQRSQLLQRHVAQTARAVQSAAADTAAVLERRADLLGQPGRIDYPTELKRWQARADQAQRMAERWE